VSELLLRPMVAEDIDEILPIERQAHAHPWTPGLFSDSLVSGYNCWVLAQGEGREERIVAYGILQIVVGEAHLLNITVDPRRQGKGLGRQLLNELIAIARPKADTLFLEVRPSNTVAVGLYTAMGFNEIGLRKNYYPAANGGREHALMMALAL
jgi:ribosomal-protein-alanine N-acetyltransferase